MGVFTTRVVGKLQVTQAHRVQEDTRLMAGLLLLNYLVRPRCPRFPREQYQRGRKYYSSLYSKAWVAYLSSICFRVSLPLYTSPDYKNSFAVMRPLHITVRKDREEGSLAPFEL